jgi:hypothetical protein
MSERPRCFYYALGGGLGHGVRTLALARQLARALGGRHLLLINTPFAPCLVGAAAAESCLSCQTLLSSASPAECLDAVRQTLATFDPDLFLADTFPRGLGGELAPALPEWGKGFRVLISRALPRAYVEAYGLAAFARRQYHLMLAPGEPSPLEGRAEIYQTKAFLVRDFEELPTPAHAAALLGTTPDRPVVLLVGSGTAAECREMEDLAEQLQAGWPGHFPPLRLALPPGRPTRPGRFSGTLITHFPLLECFPAVRLLVGGGGYNLVQEARALGLPGVFRPRPRKYDDQKSRVGPENQFDHFDQLRKALATELRKPRQGGVPYANGAREAALVIANRY